MPEKDVMKSWLCDAPNMTEYEAREVRLRCDFLLHDSTSFEAIRVKFFPGAEPVPTNELNEVYKATTKRLADLLPAQLSCTSNLICAACDPYWTCQAGTGHTQFAVGAFLKGVRNSCKEKTVDVYTAYQFAVSATKKWIKVHEYLIHAAKTLHDEYNVNPGYWKRRSNVFEPLLSYLIDAELKEDANSGTEEPNVGLSKKTTIAFFDDLCYWCRTNSNKDDYSEEVKQQADNFLCDVNDRAKKLAQRRTLQRKKLRNVMRYPVKMAFVEWRLVKLAPEAIRCARV